MKKRLGILLVLFLLVGAVAAHADLYLMSGQYRFTVAVRNSSFKDVRDCTGTVWVSGNQAQIQVRAQGYRDAHSYVMVNPAQTNVYTQVRLDEPMCRADVVDTSYKWVDGAQADTYSQSMYWGDEFGIRASLPKKGFEKLTERDVRVDVNGLGSFAPRVYLSGSTDYWRLEVVIRRRDMNSFSNNIRLVLPRDPAPAPAPTAAELQALLTDYRVNAELSRKVEPSDREIVQNRLESLARQLRTGYSALDAGERRDLLGSLNNTSPLARELTAIETFERLHR